MNKRNFPDDIWAAAEEVEARWTNNGSSISTRDLLRDGIARVILAERERCVRAIEAIHGVQPELSAVAIESALIEVRNPARATPERKT